MKIRRYDKSHKQEWDAFVRCSKNGTFLLCRDYMDYHAHRFVDHSYMFYEGDELVALIPANEKDGVFYSHQGLTYGGLIMDKSFATASGVLQIFDLLLDTLRREGFSRFVYKAIPHIYHKSPAEEDLYALFRNKAVLSERYISSAISIPETIMYSRTRKNGLKKASKNGLKVIQSQDFSSFWKVLELNLGAKYGKRPVHTLEEIAYLKSKFPDEIQLYTVLDRQGNILAGTVAFLTDTVVHLQYTAGTEEGKECGAIDFLIDCMITEVSADKNYFDYGHSNEQQGWFLNEGLIYQKEGFGARGIVYDIYAIDL